MLASARAQGDSSPAIRAAADWQAGPWRETAWPPFRAKTSPTAYSGSTAMKASTAMARPAEMSS